MPAMITTGEPMIGTGARDLIVDVPGGTGPNNTIHGGAGHDLILGDGDMVWSNLAAAGNTTLATALQIDDAAMWSASLDNPAIEAPGAHTSLYIEPGADQVRYFAVTVGAGETLTLDVDFTHTTGWGRVDTDTILNVLDADGNVLAFNDDDSTDFGSLGYYDSRVTFTPAAAGTYYLLVREYGGDNLFEGVEQVFLNVSVTGHAATAAPIAAGDDTINGGAGDDTIFGMLGTDTVHGDAGNDTIVSTGWGRYYGDDGGDRLHAGPDGEALLDGGAGNDYLYGKAGRDMFLGGDDDDELYGEGGADRLDGGAGDDRLDGGAGSDTVSYASAAAGVTVLLDRAFHDTGAGIDWWISIENVAGSNFDDRLRGNFARNVITGEAGADALWGMDGDDVLRGGDGDDLLLGGAGQDMVAGGAGRDRFQFRDGDTARTRSGADRVLDFTQGQDRIQLSAIDADATLAGDQAFAFVGTAAFSGAAGELRYGYIFGTTWLEGDTDGDGMADVLIALTGRIDVVAGDLVL